MEIKIHSKQPVFGNDLERIKGIMAEAECPNETLRRVFSRYVGTDGKGIHFDAWNASDFVYTVEFD